MDIGKTRLFFIVVIVLVAAFSLFIWLTPYHYDHMTLGNRSYPVRINRFTGKAEYLTPDGWTPTYFEADSKPEKLQSLSVMDRWGIDLSQMGWKGTGYIEGSVYNDTNYTLEDLTFLVRVYDKKTKKKLVEREYHETTFVGPRDVGRVIFDAGLNLKKGQEWEINIIEARA